MAGEPDNARAACYRHERSSERSSEVLVIIDKETGDGGVGGVSDEGEEEILLAGGGDGDEMEGEGEGDETGSSASAPSKPRTAAAKHIAAMSLAVQAAQAQILAYSTSHRTNELIFTSKFSSQERRALHDFADECGLWHGSTGPASDRHLKVQRWAPLQSATAAMGHRAVGFLVTRHHPPASLVRGYVESYSVVEQGKWRLLYTDNAVEEVQLNELNERLQLRYDTDFKELESGGSSSSGSGLGLGSGSASGSSGSGPGSASSSGSGSGSRSGSRSGSGFHPFGTSSFNQAVLDALKAACDAGWDTTSWRRLIKYDPR